MDLNLIFGLLVGNQEQGYVKNLDTLHINCVLSCTVIFRLVFIIQKYIVQFVLFDFIILPLLFACVTLRSLPLPLL